MKDDFVHLGAGALPQHQPHDEFLELCAIAASGELTEGEQKKLDHHLATCLSCREALQQYEAVVDQAIPSVAAAEDHKEVDPGPGWSQKKAEKRFFDRLERESRESAAAGNRNGNDASGFPPHPVPLPSESAWNHVWMLYAAGILLFSALGLFMYRVGIHRGTSIAKVGPPTPAQTAAPDQTLLETQLSDASHERAIARNQIAERDKTIAELRGQLNQQSDEISKLRTAQEQLQAQLQT